MSPLPRGEIFIEALLDLGCKVSERLSPTFMTKEVVKGRLILSRIIGPFLVNHFGSTSLPTLIGRKDSGNSLHVALLPLSDDHTASSHGPWPCTVAFPLAIAPNLRAIGGFVG